MRLRVSIRLLMAVVGLVAVVIAALRSASPLWASALFTLTLGILATAVLGALFADRRRRPFWTGLAVFGWGYMALAFGPWLATEVRPHLTTSTILDLLSTAVQSPVAPTYTVTKTVTPPSTPIRALTFPGGSDGYSVTYTTIRPPGRLVRPSFQRVGHSLFGLLAALLGGVIARAFARADRPEVR
jgi:hypothetical protein